MSHDSFRLAEMHAEALEAAAVATDLLSASGHVVLTPEQVEQVRGALRAAARLRDAWLDTSADAIVLGSLCNSLSTALSSLPSQIGEIR